MPLDKIEAVTLAKVFLQELEKALTDADTPGRVTFSEWGKLAQVVGVRAFQEATD